MTERLERQSPEIRGAQPCLWMSAGLVSFKLCDRDFDCEHCPLDAALRGESRDGPPAPEPEGAGAAPGGPPFSFPDDRRYGDGHTWARLEAPANGEEDVARVGLDAFAIALALPVHRVIAADAEGSPAMHGAPLGDLELDGGLLAVASPVSGRLHAWNPLWEDGSAGAAALAASPYEAGWIAEIALADPRQLETLAGADAARETALLDLRRFRRRAALHLLAADAVHTGPTLPDGGRILTDLRSILGPRRYLELLRELLS